MLSVSHLHPFDIHCLVKVSIFRFYCKGFILLQMSEARQARSARELTTNDPHPPAAHKWQMGIGT